MKAVYSREPDGKRAFTRRFDQFYSRTARTYDWLVRAVPIWRNWLDHALPHLQGERLLEVSFGTGYLLTQCAAQFETYGLDLNWEMVAIARGRLAQRGLHSNLQIADVEALPFPDGAFDTVLNTMAFSGYPDGRHALGELARVLRHGGRLVMIDVNYPLGGGRLGYWLTRFWAATGDIIRDMGPLFREFGLAYSDEEIGGFGSVHLYVATKQS